MLKRLVTVSCSSAEMARPPLFHVAMGHPVAAACVVPLLHGGIVMACGSLPLHPHHGVILQLVYIFLSCAMAARHYLRQGPTVWISNTVVIACSADAAACSRFLQEASNLGQYDQKTTGCRVWDQQVSGCMTQLWGWWWIFPFCKTFVIRYKEDGGYHAALFENGWDQILPPWLIMFGGGGFKVQKRDDNTTVLVHYERYGWPLAFPLIWLLEFPWTAWHRRGMEVEMGVVRAQIEEIEQLPRSSQKSAAVAELFPPNTWTAWKYGALHYVSEVFQLCGAVAHPRVQKSQKTT